MKSVAKGTLVSSKMTRRALAEKDILLMCDSPHIIKLFGTFRDANDLHFLMELCLCGDLHALVRKNGLYGKMPCVQYHRLGFHKRSVLDVARVHVCNCEMVKCVLKYPITSVRSL